MAAHELLGPDNWQAVVGTEHSVHTSLQGGLPLVDRLLSMREHARRIKANPFVEDVFRIGARLALATSILSPLVITDQAAATFIKPTPAEASIVPDPYRESARSSVEIISDPFNPEYFTRFGKKGVLDTTHGTTGDLGNGRTGTSDTTTYTEDGKFQADIQINGKKLLELASDIDHITTLAKKYNPENDTFYFLIALGQASRDQRDNPLAIVMMPISTIKDPETQRLMKVSLPSWIIPSNPVTGFDLSEDRSRIDLTMNNQKIYSVMLSNGYETGKVEIRQISFKVYVPGLLIGTNK